MRKLIALLTIFSFNAYAVAPTGVGGEEGSLSYTNNLKAPAYTITSLGGVNSRIETGNTNILMNPSFEHTTVTTGWTVSNATPTAETTNVVEGKKSLKLVLTAALTAYQDSTINASQLSGLQGVAAIKVKNTGAAGLKACARNAGVTSSTLCVNIPADSTWKHISIPFIMTATSNGIALTSTGTSGTVYVDDAFVGTSAPFQDVSGAKLVGGLTISNCATAWSTSSTTITDFSTSTGCTFSVFGSGLNLQSGPNYLPKISFSSLPAGDYRIEFEGLLGSSGVANNAQFQFFDGTNYAREFSSFNGSGGGTTQSNGMSQTFSYSTAQTNITFTLRGRSTGGSASATAYGQSAYPGVIKVYYFPPASKIYSQASQDYAYTNAGTITIGATTTAPTKGTIVTDRIMASRKGQNLLAKYQFEMSSIGTTGSGDYLFTLPSGLSFDTNIVIPSTAASDGRDVTTQKALVGYGHIGDGTNRGMCYLFAYDSTRFRANCGAVFGSYGFVNSGYYHLGTIRGFEFELNAPISGWSDYGVIVGSFAGLEKCANDYECTDTFSAQISSLGVKSNENIPWLSSCVKNGTGDYSCTYNTNLKDGTSALSSSMNCVVTQQGNPGNYGNTYVVTNTTTGFNYRTVITNTVTDVAVAVKCQKGSQDFRPKTAKVASSIGVPTVPGITTQSVDTFSVSYGTTNATTVCSASPCSYLDQIGTAVTSVTRASAGNYALNVSKTYSKLKCNANVMITGSSIAAIHPTTQLSCSSCSSLNFSTTDGTIKDSFGTIVCQGSY